MKRSLAFGKSSRCATPGPASTHIGARFCCEPLGDASRWWTRVEKIGAGDARPMKYASDRFWLARATRPNRGASSPVRNALWLSLPPCGNARTRASWTAPNHRAGEGEQGQVQDRILGDRWQH